MASPEGTEAPFLARRLGYVAAGIGTAALSLLLLQLSLGRRLEQAQTRQAGAQVAASVSLGEVALERFSPEVLAQIGGMRLSVGPRPEPAPAGGERFVDGGLRARAESLRGELCRRLGRCPAIVPSADRPRGVWVEMASPLETVWLFAPLPSPRGWPPDPLLLSVSIGAGGLAAVLLFLTQEVQRPLRRLEGALADVGLEARPAPLPAQGALAVRELTHHFNAMVERLERTGRERTTMLAGIAHDLRSPLTRLRLRLSLAAMAPMGIEEVARSEADLEALERITRQFLLYAGAEAAEPVVEVPLDRLVAEAAAVAGHVPIDLELAPLQRRVRPTALSRAVANLLENALAHGRPPLRLVLRPTERPRGRNQGEGGFEIQVWDRGDGIPADRWEQALMPFQRLDRARGGPGHCGLGLAIADRVAQEHGGGLSRREGPWGFAVVLAGRSLPAASTHTDPA